METRFIYLEARISPGAFSGECVFELKLSSGEHYVGLAPRNYCRQPDGEPLPAGSPKKEGINGKVAARLIRNGGGIPGGALSDGGGGRGPPRIISPPAPTPLLAPL